MAKKKRLSEIVDLKTKVVPWANFEIEVADFMENSIKVGDWPLNAAFASIRRKPSYFSNVRKRDITFDVSVELSGKGHSPTLLWLWIIECKDYPDRKVKVDEIEEFHSKLEQVGAHKGTVFTRCGFESGAVEAAKSYGIGLSVLQKEEHVVFQFSASGGAFFSTDVESTFKFNGAEETDGGSLSKILHTMLEPYGITVFPASLSEREISFDSDD